MATMENLPDEVLSNIFIRLLAKQLAQMRSLCKPWNALLSDSSFVKSHLHHSIHNKDQILLFFHLMVYFDHSPFTARASTSPDLELANFIKPPVIPRCQYGYGSLIGSMNGLICFSYGSYPDDYVIYIWNPSLSVVLTLPPSSLSSSRLNFGIGFDLKSNDYKILKLTSFSRAPNKVKQDEVYSMRKGSWKLITPQTFPSHITLNGGRNKQVCVDDNIHWLCHTDLDPTQETIVAFDLVAETFHETPLSETIIDPKVYNWPIIVLGALGGKLCVMSCVVLGNCEVWVMDVYGVSTSWVKHHVFSQIAGFITPYGFTSHGEFLFQVDDEVDLFGLYDPVAAKTKTFNIKSRFF